MDIIETNKTIARVEDYNVPLSAEDIRFLATQADNIVGKVTGVVSDITSTVRDVAQLSNMVKMECARLDHALDCLMVKAQRDVAIYEQSLPILDRQFSACQKRMDTLMDKAVELITSDVSESALQKQEAMMNLIEITNNSINSLISKLIPSY